MSEELTAPELDSINTRLCVDLVAVQIERDRLRETIKQMRDACVCTRGTNGFDYSENHPKMGKPKPGARWLTPNDLAVVAGFSEISESLKVRGQE